MAWTRKYYLKNNYLTLIDLEVKGLTKVITVCDVTPYGHAPTNLNDTI